MPESRPSNAETRRAPAHQQVYERLRDLVLFGDLAPGQPVTIQGLVARLGAGMTPVREAIRRLTSEGALEFQGNRRVCVPVLTSAHLEELMFARQAIEPKLTRKALERATEDDVQQLEKIDKKLDEAIHKGDVGAYLKHNFEFHNRLYAIADSPILTQLSHGLWLRFGPSLRVVCGRMGTQSLPDQHKETLDAMRKGDADRAAEAIRKDVVQGMVQVREALDLAGNP
ncbi:DNA-binding transcriptional regulator, GntR family [Salinihabitans flavidus]|uniref:DNA-binding transcriptional regulator, GntR family n=1 Tax=Salinihabitans flavidus TaxID=569882 RepID=A0A1H8LNM8_9RHOB|nr:GntR family transcriptional regulator [Salinihabitans flavidus]SEO06751.1 DNA-binding transcriptional regulator, GntR family [Salinihabitans flavidus]